MPILHKSSKTRRVQVIRVICLNSQDFHLILIPFPHSVCTSKNIFILLTVSIRVLPCQGLGSEALHPSLKKEMKYFENHLILHLISVLILRLPAHSR